jgi:hypothetical protein
VDLRDVIKAAREQGYEVIQTKRGHWRFIPPDPSKEIAVHPGTSGDVNSIRLTLARLRRQGFVWPWPPTPTRKKGRDG